LDSLLDLLDSRRAHLYRSAAPLFARDGYRATKMRGLSRACGLSAGGIYHYFPSKLDLALFPIFARERAGGECATALRASRADPLERLRFLIDACGHDLDDFVLSLRLAQEAGAQERVERASRAIFEESIRTFATVAQEIAPRLTLARSLEFGQAIVALYLGSGVPGFNREPSRLRAHAVAVARAYLCDEGADGIRFDAALADRAS
jgi:AcrR family transcriptional regulator